VTRWATTHYEGRELTLEERTEYFSHPETRDHNPRDALCNAGSSKPDDDEFPPFLRTEPCCAKPLANGYLPSNAAVRWPGDEGWMFDKQWKWLPSVKHRMLMWVQRTRANEHLFGDGRSSAKELGFGFLWDADLECGGPDVVRPLPDVDAAFTA